MFGWYPLSKGYRIVLASLVLFCALFFVLHSTPAFALTTVPTKMNFQGRLTNSSGNIMPNGTYNMKLRLYTVSSGGSAVWTEDRLVSASQGVTVTNGLFVIKLGDVTTLPASLFASGALYLEVELPTPATATSSSPTWTEGAMTPRNQMATSAYAYNSETLDGLDSVAFGQLSQGNTWTGANVFSADTSIIKASSASAFTVSSAAGAELFSVDTAASRVIVGDTVADGTGVVLVLDTKNTAGDPTGVDGAMYYNSSMRAFRCYQNGAWRSCIGGLAYTNTAVSNTIANTTAETNFNTTHSIPAGSCQPGRVYRITARGIFNSYNAGLGNAGTLTIRVKLGSTVVGATAATAMGNNRQDRLWTADFNMTCITYGASGTVEGQGMVQLFTAANTNTPAEMSNLATVSGIDLTAAQSLSLSAQFSVANAGNTIVLRQLVVEDLGL